MKEVTFTGGSKEYSGVQVGATYYPLDVPVVVKNADADALGKLEGFSFRVKDTDERTSSAPPGDEAPPAADGFGGSDPTTGETPEEE